MLGQLSIAFGLCDRFHCCKQSIIKMAVLTGFVQWGGAKIVLAASKMWFLFYLFLFKIPKQSKVYREQISLAGFTLLSCIQRALKNHNQAHSAKERSDLTRLHLQSFCSSHDLNIALYTLIKNKIKFSSFIRKFRGIGCKVIYRLTISSYMVKIFVHFLLKPFLIYDFAPDPMWISSYMRKI